MLFNSIDFAIFLPVVFILYWYFLNKNLKLQNLLIVIASYIFYGWWDWKFLSLIIFSTIVDFSIGILLRDEENKRKRKILLWSSILVNLGFLGFFKYYNFFLDNFINAFSLFGMNLNVRSLNIILPVGISFYTFQTLSYTIDVYKKKLQPTKDFIAFSAFVSFFPQLVAGPIERATHLLPQVLKERNLNKDELLVGIKLIIYGFFLKIFIADILAPAVDDIFVNYKSMPGGNLILGAVFFSFQIYGDFSGYSKIARGTAMLFGFNLMQNFNFPYFSRNIGEFWRRWHISLNTWFRDYLYIPLGGSKEGKFRSILNIFTIFLVSGFWHGANWTFIVWGAIHSLFFVPIFLSNSNRKYTGGFQFNRLNVDKFKQLLGVLTTYVIVTFAWIFFRSETIKDAFLYVQKLNFNFQDYLYLVWIIPIAILVDILVQKTRCNKILYPILAGAVIAAAMSTSKSEFIYFQF
jgi:D-alanyl-lipoteichoic acid acyltransferase DltB (MBOAT superfamily)